MHGLIKIINMFSNRGELPRHNHMYDAGVFFSSSAVCFCRFVLIVSKVKMVFALLSPPRGQIENNTFNPLTHNNAHFFDLSGN